MDKIIYHIKEKKFYVLLSSGEEQIHCREIIDPLAHVTFYASEMNDIINISDNIKENQGKISEISTVNQSGSQGEIMLVSKKNQIESHGYFDISDEFQGDIRKMYQMIVKNVNTILKNTNTKETKRATLLKYESAIAFARANNYFEMEEINERLKGTIKSQITANKNREAGIRKKKLKKIFKIISITVLVVSILIGALFIYLRFFYKAKEKQNIQIIEYNYTDKQLDSAINSLKTPVYEWRRGELKRIIKEQKLNINKLDSINKTF